MKARSSARGSESIGKAVTMKSLRRMIAVSLERLAVMLLIGTAAIYAAAQRMDPSRLDD